MQGISKELQIGKAGEHFVCCDLILQGYNAFLADAGLPYDVIVDVNGRFYRVQVRSTQSSPKSYKKARSVYRFMMRRARGNRVRYEKNLVDVFAFVVFKTKKVAYLPIEQIVTSKGSTKTTMDFKSRTVKYRGRTYPNGKIRTVTWGKFHEDYSKFSNCE